MQIVWEKHFVDHEEDDRKPIKAWFSEEVNKVKNGCVLVFKK